MRLCAWFWHHQLARGTHTPPVRGKHPACSRNCQAGLTAGTPCSALRGLSENPFLAVTLTVLILLGLSTWPVELFLPFLERTYRCRSPCSRASTRNPLLPLLLRDSSPNAWHSPGLLPPRSQSLPEPPNHRTPHPRVYPGGRNLQPRVARPGSQATPRGERCGLVKRAEASAAGRGTPLLTRRSPRAAGRGCGARCGVRDPERCGPSRCYSLRGLGLGGGASLLGWERPAGQGGSEPAQSPPRPTAAGGGPASPGRFHLRAGPRPRAPAATKATGPRPSCNPQPVGGGGAARSVRDCEGGGAGWARDGRHARSAWPLAARRAQTEPRANFPRGAAERSAPAFLSRSPL